MKAIYFPTEGKLEVIDLPDDADGRERWAYMRRRIGCDLLEIQILRHGSLCLFFDEEGKFRNGSIPNEAATNYWLLCLAKEGRQPIPGDYIAGKAILCGYSPQGNDRNIPLSAIRELIPGYTYARS
jgi:hypothetical protein